MSKRKLKVKRALTVGIRLEISKIVTLIQS